MTDTPEVATPVADRMAAARAARAANQAAKAAQATAPVAAPSLVLGDDPGPVAHTPEAATPATATTMEKAALTEDARRAAKVAALRAAKVTSADPVAEQRVTVRITKKGHGQVSTGEHIGGLGDLTYDHNEEPSLPRSMALELEDRGFAEIQ